MKAKGRHLALALSLVLATGVLAGVAAAGNPHGTPPGQAKKQASSSSSASSSTSTAGVKPSSTTAHGQHNTHATAGSNQTKLYGNGKTAGQIAQQNGATADTDLYGPGNSQPHKVKVCSKNGKSHYVDVHAMKAHSSSSCTSNGSTAGATAGTAAATAGTAAATVAIVRPVSTVESRTGVLGSTRAGGVLAATHTTRSGVLAATHTTRSKGVAGSSKPAHAVTRSASFTG